MYGTLALLPVFMVWIYCCWIIVLSGMAFAGYLQDGMPATTPPATGSGGSASQTHMPQGFACH
jgi:uncharacterized BrkB/YihY/UPF0761 family membrane protein